MHCWGYNASGQLGDGTTTNRTTAVATVGLTSRVWDRLGGSDRYATAAAVSRSAFPTGGAGAVVLARGDAYPDALVGVPLAAARHAPLLLTHGSHAAPVHPDRDPPRAAGRRHRVPARRHRRGPRQHRHPADQPRLPDHPLRRGGPVRHRRRGRRRPRRPVHRAAGLRAELPRRPGRRTRRHRRPRRGAAHHRVATLPPVTAAYLAAHPGTVYAIGGPAAAADPTAQPLVGADRYATAATVAATFFPTPTTVGIATGLNFPDALAGAAQLATAGGPLLLTTTTVLPAATGSALTAAKASITTTHYYGQTDVVADPVALAAAASLGY